MDEQELQELLAEHQQKEALRQEIERERREQIAKQAWWIIPAFPVGLFLFIELIKHMYT